MDILMNFAKPVIESFDFEPANIAPVNRFDFEVENPPTLDLDTEFSGEESAFDTSTPDVLESPMSSPQEEFTKEDPDSGMTLHGFTGKVLDPKTNTLKHYIQGEQVHSQEYEDSLLSDPDIHPTTEEGWSHEGEPLSLGEDAIHTKGQRDQTEDAEKGGDALPTETTPEDPRNHLDPHEASYDMTGQAQTLHGDDTAPQTTPEAPGTKGESDHVLGAEGELEEANPEEEQQRQESLKFVQKSAITTLGKFPEAAKAAIKKNAPNVSFFSSPAKLSEELAKLSPEVADNVSKGILYHGAYLPESKRLLLDGGNEKGTTEEIHSYEMSRAMADGKDETPEWKAAVDKDFKDEALTVYANDPKRAWGEFGRLAIGKQVSPDALRQKYPSATAVWESYGLLPKGGKGEIVQLPEIFKPDVALSDDPKAEADSAYSLKEAGIATYARMGRQSLSWLKDNVDLVGDWAKGILAKTPPKLRMAVTGALKKIYFSYYLANQVTSQLAKQRGYDEDKAKWLASTLTGADFLFGTSKILPIVTAAGASSAGASPLLATGVAIAANFLPVGSLAYIALASGGKYSALDTWKKASKKVKTIVSKRKEAGAEFSDFEKEDLLEVIASHIAASDAKDHHLWLACFLSAMDETEGNVRISCEIADEASEGGDTDFSEGDDPTPEIPKPITKTEKTQAKALTAPREVDPLGLYSPLHDSLANAKQQKMTPHQWRQHFSKTSGTGYASELQKRLNKITGEMEELPWTPIEGTTPKEKSYLIPHGQAEVLGMENLLGGKKAVTADEIKEHLKANHKPFSEVDQSKIKPHFTFTGDDDENKYEDEDEAMDARNAHVNERLANDRGIQDEMDDVFEKYQDTLNYGRVEPEHDEEDDTWTVDGNQYDTEKEAQEAAEEINEKVRDEAEESLRREIADTRRDELLDYHTVESHDGEGGNKYGNEDWQLLGPKKSWTDKEPDYNELHVTAPGEKREWDDGHAEYSHVKNPISRLRYNLRNDVDGNKVFHLEEIQGPSKDSQEDMPPHLRDRIYEIGMKRAIVKAVESGADKLTWTTGNQQADRYDVSNHINNFKYLTKDNTLQGFDNRGLLVFEEKKSPNELPEFMGKELSEKLLGTEPYETGGGNKVHSIEGVDVKVGGEGHRKNYDERIPSIVKDILKKTGAKVRTTDIPDGDKRPSIGVSHQGGPIWNPVTRTEDLKNAPKGSFIVYDAGGEPSEHFPTKEAAEEYMKKEWKGLSSSQTVHSVDLTPGVKEHVKRGLASFSQEEDEEGIVDFGEAGPDDVTIKRTQSYEPNKGNPTPIVASKESDEAAGHSGKALDATIHALRNSKHGPQHSKLSTNENILATATRAHKNAKQGSHGEASLDHSMLFRMHRGRGHEEAHKAHWDAMIHNENVAKEGKKFGEFSGNVLDLDKEFAVADFSKKHWDTPEFKKWFEGSKVVHPETAEPRKMFHGTTAKKDFGEFLTQGKEYDSDDPTENYGDDSGHDPTAFLGAHFAEEPEVADKFAGEGKLGWDRALTKTRGRVYPTYLSIKNPKEFEEEGSLLKRIYRTPVNSVHVDDYLQASGDESDEYDTNPSYREDIHESVMSDLVRAAEGENQPHLEFAKELADAFRDKLIEKGYDGIKYKNGVEGGTSWVAFHPHQIKSAIGNKGTYSSEDPRIDFSQESGLADFTKSKVQMVVDALKKDFREPDKGRKLKATIKEGLEEGSQSVIERFYKGEVPKEVEALKKKYIDNQMDYLVAYVDGVYKGNIAIDPNRSAMYANSLKTFQAEILRFKAQQKDAKWERRVLGKGDSSCTQCVKLYLKGWKKFGSLPQIGDTTCKSNCNCKFQYDYDKKKPQ